MWKWEETKEVGERWIEIVVCVYDAGVCIGHKRYIEWNVYLDNDAIEVWMLRCSWNMSGLPYLLSAAVGGKEVEDRERRKGIYIPWTAAGLLRGRRLTSTMSMTAVNKKKGWEVASASALESPSYAVSHDQSRKDRY